MFVSILRIGAAWSQRILSKNAKCVEPPRFLRKIHERPFLEFMVSATVLLVAWSPYFILLSPGIVTADTLNEISQAMGDVPLSDHHPILYTGFLKITLTLGVFLTGNIGCGLIVSGLTQMVLLAGIFSLAIVSIDFSFRYSWLIRIATLAFFALNPLIGWYSITLWKDVLFSAFVLLLCSSTVSFSMREHPAQISVREGVVFFFALLGVLFLKKSGIYLVLPTVLTLIIARPGIRKALASISISALAFYMIVHGALMGLLGVIEGDSREALSVPLQQVARVVAYDQDSLSDSDKQAISAVLPLEDLSSLYYAKVSDNVKSTFETDVFKNNITTYAKLYFKLGISHPIEYLDAFLSGTSGYWYPETKYWSVSGSDYRYVLDSYTEWGWTVYDNPERYDSSKTVSPEREEAVDFVTGIKNIPILSALLSIGLWVWIYFSLFCFLPRHLKKKLASVFMLVAMVWITCLISPVYAETRYAYPLLLMLPLVYGATAIAVIKDNEAVESTINSAVTTVKTDNPE